MKHPVLLGGLLFGAFMGTSQVISLLLASAPLSEALTVGAGIGLAAGTAFGLGLHLLIHSNWFRRQSALQECDLIADEHPLAAVPVNLIVCPKDFGLQRFAFDSLLWIVGMKDKEALGGTLHITNHRLLFRTHWLNRLRGTVSIFLVNIEGLRDASFAMTESVVLRTAVGTITLVANDAQDLISRIEQAREAMTLEQMESFRQRLAADPSKCVHDLHAWRAVNAINDKLALHQDIDSVAAAALNPLATLGSIFLMGFIENNVSAWWQAKLDDGATHPCTHVDPPGKPLHVPLMEPPPPDA